jgi:hypothetical protein
MASELAVDAAFEKSRKAAEGLNLSKGPRAHREIHDALDQMADPDGVIRVTAYESNAAHVLDELKPEEVPMVGGLGALRVGTGPVSFQEDMEQIKLDRQRDRDYDDTHVFINQVLKLAGDRLEKIRDVHMLYYWVMILAKLGRALASPTKEDHWRDVIGYAQLAIGVLHDLPSK